MSVYLFPHVSPVCPALLPLLFPVQFCSRCHYLAPCNLCPCLFFYFIFFPTFAPQVSLFIVSYLVLCFFFPFCIYPSQFRLMDCFSTCLISGLNESVVSCGAEVLVLLDYLLAIDLKCPSDRELSMMEIND